MSSLSASREPSDVNVWIGYSSSVVDISKVLSESTSSITSSTDPIDRLTSCRLSQRNWLRQYRRTSIHQDSSGRIGSVGSSTNITWWRDVDEVLGTHRVRTAAHMVERRAGMRGSEVAKGVPRNGIRACG
jgi:hypothetical protein